VRERRGVISAAFLRLRAGAFPSVRVRVAVLLVLGGAW